MSGAEQVQSFNPLLVLIWITNLVLLIWDWSSDGVVRWSIPIIGSFLIIQLYMVWKTNYDDMMDQQSTAQARMLGGPVDTPEIVPGETKLNDLYKSKDQNTSKEVKKKGSDQVINLNAKPAEEDQ